MKIVYILLMIAGPVLILEADGSLLMMIAGMLLLLISAVMLVSDHETNPSEFDDLERKVYFDNRPIDRNSPFKNTVLFIVASIIPGLYAMIFFSEKQWLTGSIIMLIWAYPYWRLLNYFNKRSLLKMRLGFSLTVTFLMLASTYYLSKPPTSSTNSTLTNKTINATHAKTKQPN